MILYNKEIINKLNNWPDDSIYVLSDFDRTLTSYDSKTSWSILYDYEKINKNFKETANNLYEYYRPIELNETMNKKLRNKKMQEWWIKVINLAIEYQVTPSIIKELTNNKNVMKFRAGAKKFLKNMYQRKIPLIIISAGLGNLIEEFLHKNNCYYNNIYIISNFLEFQNEKVIGIKSNIIHSLNKNETSLPTSIKEKLQNRPNIILLGDQIADIKMLSSTHQNKALKVGFLDYDSKENKEFYLTKFDIVCTNKTSYNTIMKEFPIFYKETK